MPRQITKTVYTFKEMLELEKEKKMSSLAVDKAREWLQQGNVDHDWWDSIYEDWTAALKDVGFGDESAAIDIKFSGFWSQGDGASFSGPVDITKLILFMSNPPPAAESPAQVGESGTDWQPWIVHRAEGVRSNPNFVKLRRVIDRLEMSVDRTDSRYAHWNTCRVSSAFHDGGEYVDDPEAKPGGWPRKWKSKQPRLWVLWNDFVEAVEQLRKDLCHAIYKDLEEEYEYQTADEQLLDAGDVNEYTFDEFGSREG